MNERKIGDHTTRIIKNDKSNYILKEDEDGSVSIVSCMNNIKIPSSLAVPLNAVREAMGFNPIDSKKEN